MLGRRFVNGIVPAALTAACMGLGPAREARAQALPDLSGDPIQGRRIFIERGCPGCHSIWGNGGTLGPDLGEVGGGRSLLQLAGMFWNHTPRMIETVRNQGLTWSEFTESELADVISYIYYVKLFDPPGDPVLGERWFVEKRCRDCHAVGSSGGSIAPALDGYARYIAPIPLAQGMWNSGPAMRAVQAAVAVPMPLFFGSEIADIQAYIRSASNAAESDVSLLPPPDPENGARLFHTKQCSHCHGSTGRGTSLGPDLRTAIEQLRVSEIAGTLWTHSARMTEEIMRQGITFPRFEGAELADVIAYLYYLRFHDAAGSVQEGERLFTTKGCALCHALDGRAAVGPDLRQSEAATRPLGLATAMWGHAPAMYDRAEAANIEWPLFEGDEMRDLSAYLMSLGSDSR
jgi:cytochrome c2